MRPEFNRSLARVVRAAVLIALVTPTAARAAEEKLDVYVNPLEFEHRIPPLAIGDPAPKLAVDRWMQVVSRAQSFLSPASVASLALEAAERANALTLGSDADVVRSCRSRHPRRSSACRPARHVCSRLAPHLPVLQAAKVKR